MAGVDGIMTNCSGGKEAILDAVCNNQTDHGDDFLYTLADLFPDRPLRLVYLGNTTITNVHVLVLMAKGYGAMAGSFSAKEAMWDMATTSKPDHQFSSLVHMLNGHGSVYAYHGPAYAAHLFRVHSEPESCLDMSMSLA